jgi:hypothetical protein
MKLHASQVEDGLSMPTFGHVRKAEQSSDPTRQQQRLLTQCGVFPASFGELGLDYQHQRRRLIGRRMGNPNLSRARAPCWARIWHRALQ